MTEPMTAAGRALWLDMTARSGGEALHPAWVEHLRQRILAIEAEARAAALDEARAAVETIRPVWLSGPDDKSVNLAQVLAAIDALREGE